MTARCARCGQDDSVATCASHTTPEPARAATPAATPRMLAAIAARAQQRNVWLISGEAV